MMSVENELSCDAVLAQLDRIRSSDDFNASTRNRTFLDYVVRETLGGRADRIKAYSIATTVLGRGTDFDPQSDSIVRIEAGRLRRALERYYLISDISDPIRITIPTGTYVPQFTLNKRGLADRSAHSRHPHSRRPGILVRHFEEDGVQPKYAGLPHGLVRQIVAGLTRFPDLLIFGPDMSLAQGARGDADLPQNITIDFYLTGGTTVADDHFGVEVLLVDAKTGLNVWAEAFGRPIDPDRSFEARDEVAATIVRALAQPYGVLFSIHARKLRQKSPEEMSSFDYVTLFHEYRKTFDATLMENLHKGLEKAVIDEPDYSEAFACLSQVYVDSWRFRYPLAVGNVALLPQAGALARRAVELSPRSSNAFCALSQTLWYGGDMIGGLAALETALTFNPNDTELRGKLGMRYILRMDWDRGVPLVQQSYQINPVQPGYYRIGLVFWHLAFGRYAEAHGEAVKMNTPHLIYANLMAAITATKLGKQAEAAAVLQQVAAMDPDYIAYLEASLVLDNAHPDLVRLIIQALPEKGMSNQQAQDGSR